jgi:hypothetical protein
MRGPLVDVYVGPEKKHYPLPKLLLIHHSKFFEKCFNGQFKEGQTQKLDLPEDKAFHFDILIEYMSRGNPSLVINATGNKAFIIGQCMDFIQYAGKYDLWEATSAVYERLIRHSCNGDHEAKGNFRLLGSTLRLCSELFRPAILSELSLQPQPSHLEDFLLRHRSEHRRKRLRALLPRCSVSFATMSQQHSLLAQ